MSQPSHAITDLIHLFNQCFIPLRKTELVCCEAEPVYLPAVDHNANHRIIFAHGFFASALHEIAHWCIAGKERRLLEDFGYWYQPDGRSLEQQQEFERVEIKPQALEWIFSVACNHQFHFSADNLEANPEISKTFQLKVLRQVKDYLSNGLPEDADIWAKVLLENYRQNRPIELNEFTL